MTNRRSSKSAHRGAILLEAILALAVFVIAGSAILNLVRQTMTGLGQSRLTAQAADLARSAMAKIEAGIDTPQTLNGPLERQPGEESQHSGWELRIETEPSQFRGLTRVTVEAVKRGEGAAESLQADYKLIQLVRLSGKGEDKAGDQDSLAQKAQQRLSKPPTPPEKGASPK